jgi:hypothetical protein
MADEPTPAPDDPRTRLKGLQMIALALVVGLVIIGGMMVAASVALAEPRLGDPWTGAGLAATVVGLVVAATTMAAGLVVVPRVMPRMPVTGDPLGVFTAEWFVRAGLVEGPGVLQLVLFLVSGNPLLLVGAGVAVLALVAIAPTDQRYAAWLAARNAG